MPHQNVITLSEQGLLLNTFGTDKIYPKAHTFASKQNIILFADQKNVILYNLKNNKIINEFEINDVKEIKLSDCGNIGAITTYTRKLYVINHKEIIREFDMVESFEVSSMFVVFSSKCIIYTFKIDTQILLENINDAIKFNLAGNSLIYTVVKKKNEKSILRYKNLNRQGHLKNYDFTNIEDFKSKVSEDLSLVLIYITTDYAANSYFGTSSLYLLNCESGVLKEFSYLTQVIFFDFFNNDIIICNGHQPSDCIIFDRNMKEKKKFPKSVRNRAVFNPHSNLVCFAGFDNLNGLVQVYSNELLTKFQVLGASEIIWSPCGSYFIVAITNKLKVDNRITVYDFFGRVIEEKKFRNLISCVWYGETEPFKEIERPAILNILKEEEYVPPHLRKDSTSLTCSSEKKFITKTGPKKNFKRKPVSNSTTNNQTKTQTIREKMKEKSKDELKLELEEIASYKRRIRKGECLNIDCMNKLLNEDEIIRRLKKL